MPSSFSSLPTEIRQRILFIAVSSAAGNSENLRLARIESVSALEKVRKANRWVWGVNQDSEDSDDSEDNENSEDGEESADNEDNDDKVAAKDAVFTAEVPITTIPDEAPSELRYLINSLIAVDHSTTNDMLWVLEKLQTRMEEILLLAIERYCDLRRSCYHWDQICFIDVIEEEHGPVSEDEFLKQEEVLYAQASDAFAAQSDIRLDLLDVLVAGKRAVALVGAEVGFDAETAFTQRGLDIDESCATVSAKAPPGTAAGSNYIYIAEQRIGIAKHGLNSDEWTTVVPKKTWLRGF